MAMGNPKSPENVVWKFVEVEKLAGRVVRLIDSADRDFPGGSDRADAIGHLNQLLESINKWRHR